MVLAAFPNPALLPFLAAGGAISGAAFGLMYTVTMQLGYNYFGKRALKQMEEGADLETVLVQIQKEIQPFSDKMMVMAIDSLPGTIDKTMRMFGELTAQFGADTFNYISNLLGLPGNMPKESYEKFVKSFGTSQGVYVPPEDKVNVHRHTIEHHPIKKVNVHRHTIEHHPIKKKPISVSVGRVRLSIEAKRISVFKLAVKKYPSLRTIQGARSLAMRFTRGSGKGHTGEIAKAMNYLYSRLRLLGVEY